MNALNLELVRELAGLRGLRCQGYIAGEGTGSIVALHFGDLIQLKRPSGNVRITEVMRSYEGTKILYVACAWRLEDESQVVTASIADNRPGREMLAGLDVLVSRVVTEVPRPEAPGFDLSLKFEGGVCFRAFCDQAEEDGQNYTLLVPGAAYVVGAKSRVIVERRAGEGAGRG